MWPGGLAYHLYGPHLSRVNAALNVNYRHRRRPEIAARDKVIESQLNEWVRVEQCQLQGVECEHHGTYLFSQMDSLLLPKVLELVGTRYSQSQFYRTITSTVSALTAFTGTRTSQQLCGQKRRLE